MLGISDFRPIDLADKPLFDAFFADHPVAQSENMFTTMISWGEYLDCHFFSTPRDMVIMTHKKVEGVQFRPPLGQQDLDLARQVLELALREGGDTPLAYIDEPSKVWLEGSFPNIIFTEDRDLFDYVYRTPDLVELPGTAYAKIRNQLRKFQWNQMYGTEPITGGNIKDAQDFLERWCQSKDCESEDMLEHEKNAIEYSLAHFQELGLSGLAIRIKGRIEAISVFEGMNQDTAVIHYEKGFSNFEGIYKAINNETATILSGKYPFVDREADLGVPGLRRAKMAYRPHHLLKLYSVKRENLVI